MSKSHVYSTLHMLGSTSGLYYHYGIPKYALAKTFGVYEHYKNRQFKASKRF